MKYVGLDEVRAARPVPAVRPRRGGGVKKKTPFALKKRREPEHWEQYKERWGSATGEVSSKVDAVNLCTAPIGCLRETKKKECRIASVGVHPVGGYWGVALARTVPLTR